MPYAAVAINTVGSRHQNQIIELAVAVIRRGQAEPRVEFDSLIQPTGKLKRRKYSGISTEALRDAPTFAELAESVLAVLANRVVAAHNSSFVLGALADEFQRCGIEFMAPHLCTLRLEGLLAHEDGGPTDRSLDTLARHFGVEPAVVKSARAKAECVGRCLTKYLLRMKKGEWRTFSDLGLTLDEASFVESFAADPIPSPQTLASDRGLLCPRKTSGPVPRSPRARYLQMLLAVVADLQVDPGELDEIQRLKETLDLSVGEIRAVHARVFSAALDRYGEDTEIDMYESENLFRLAAALRRLGWAPGDSPELGKDEHLG